MSASDTISTLL